MCVCVCGCVCVHLCLWLHRELSILSEAPDGSTVCPEEWQIVKHMHVIVSPYCSYHQTLFIDRSNHCGQRSKVAEVCINSTNKLKRYLGFFGNDWYSSPEEIVWMLLCSYKTWSDPKVMRVQKQSPCSDAKHAPRTLRERYAVWLMVSWNER